MKKALIFLFFGLLSASFIFAQTKPASQPAPQQNPGSMNCPMMGKMAGHQQGPVTGKMDHKMRCAKNGMCGMSILSADDISAMLGSKKSEIGLTDAQVKQVANVIAEAQKKSDEKMQALRANKTSAGMQCCCMEKSAE